MVSRTFRMGLCSLTETHSLSWPFFQSQGAGKTTTLQVLTAEFPPTSGDATLAGYSVRKEPQKTRRRIGYCPQVSQFCSALNWLECHFSQSYTLVFLVRCTFPAAFGSRKRHTLCRGEGNPKRAPSRSGVRAIGTSGFEFYGQRPSECRIQWWDEATTQLSVCANRKPRSYLPGRMHDGTCLNPAVLVREMPNIRNSNKWARFFLLGFNRASTRWPGGKSGM